MEAVLEQARALGDKETLAYILNSTATCFAENGDFSKALLFLNESLELARNCGNRIQEMNVLMNLGAAYLWLGMYKHARTVIEQALHIAESMGVRGTMALGYLNLGEVYWFSGDAVTARQLLERAFDECTAYNWQRGQAIALNELGMVLESSGDAAGAARYHSRAREIGQAIKMMSIEYEACAGLARCALVQGSLDEALKLAADVWNYLKAHGIVGMENPFRSYVICADVFDALGDAVTARQIAAAGYAELKKRADKLSDPKAQQALLENDPFNRALVELWERMGGG
jgi:tetratricopeptide (TPR) repeat protein